MEDNQIIKKIKYGMKIQSELHDLEFKTANTNIPNNIWKSISAFGNSRHGGLIIFGLNQELNEITGCSNIDQMQTKLTEHFNDKMSFILRPEYHVIEMGNKTILAIVIPECPKDYLPYYYKPVGLPDGAYIREGNTNRKITDNELRTYIASSKEFQFDCSEAVGIGKEDLSIEKIKKLLQESEGLVRRGAYKHINNSVLETLGIINIANKTLYVTIGGFLIFSNKAPQDIAPYNRYIVRCVRYEGSDPSSDILDSRDLKGTLDELIDDAYNFVLKNIKKRSIIIGTKRIEKYEYPESAIREIIANAIIHRDYKIHETYVQIKIFVDRIEITNPGCLPPGVTVNNIKDAQFSRNSLIAVRLRDMHYLEEYGRGIDIVMRKMHEWGLQDPLFRNSVNTFQVILLGDKYKEMNERQIRLIDVLLIKNRLTANDCKKILRGTPRATINSDLKRLKELGMISANGASVNTYYTMGF